MRLTLRTLLAYLDDRLSPSNARELGQKLKQSPFAQELAERIKGVVRRRRLAREENARTIDANLLAEYLDDQLTPELITLIEKEVLASDQSLAEVAATHQILGLLADPVELSPVLRDRLYQLDPATDGSVDAAASAEQRPADWQPLPKQAEQQRRSPMILLAAMVLGWLILLTTDGNLLGTGTQDDELVAQADPDGNEELRAHDDGEQNSNGEHATQVAQAANTQQQTDGTGENPAEEIGQAGTTAQHTGDDNETDSGDAKVPNPVNPDAGENTAGTDTQRDNEKEGDVPRPVVAELPHIELIDTDNVVSLLELETAKWARSAAAGIQPATSWTKYLNGKLIAVPEPFTARLLAPDAGWDLQLVGPCLALVDAVEGRVRIVDGRGLLRRYEGAEAADFHLVTNGGEFIMSAPEAPGVAAIGCGPRINGATPEGDSAYPLASHSLVQICAYEADIAMTLTNADGTVPELSELVVGKDTCLMWDSSAGHKPEARQEGALLPDWVAAESGETDPLVAQVREDALTIYSGAESSADAVVALLKDKNPQLSGFGVSHLVLDRDIERLATTLLASDQESTRVGCVMGIQKLLAESAVFEQRLVVTLETRLPEMELGNAMKLIRGVTPVAAEDPEVSSWLLELLRNQRAAMRELAILNLERLTGERYGFFAGDDATRRDAALRRWRKHMERNDGRILKAGQ